MDIARRRGGDGGVAAAAGDGEGGGVFADQAAVCGRLCLCSGSGSSSSSATLRSPASSGLTDDGGEVTSTSPDGGGGDCSFSCSSESELESDEEEMMQLDGDGHAAGGPLYELAAPLLAQLPLRTGLSKYYQGKSQSFTSLCNARCIEDLAKKTTPYITRMKLQLHRGHGSVVDADRLLNSRHAPGPCSKTMAKKAPRCSSDRLLSRARTTSLFTAAAAAADHLHTRARKSCQDAS